MGLNLIHGPECEPVTLEQAKTYLRVDHEQEDDIIRHLIKTARQAVESYTARAIINQTWRFTFNAGFGESCSDQDYLSGIKIRGERGIELPRSPFIRLTGKPKLIDIYGEHDVNDYRLDTSSRVAHIHFASGLINLWAGRGVLQVDFVAGYGALPEDVPAPFRQAILMAMTQLYDCQGCANDNGFMGMPLHESIIQLIKPYRLFRLG